MIEESFESALRSPDPVAALRSLATQYLSQGQDRAAILERFEKVRQALRQGRREQDEDPVLEVMDFRASWCSPHMRLFPDPASQPADPSTTTKV